MASIMGKHQTTAIVLAGGLGTRLKNVVADIPKPMAPIKDKPFLFYIFKYLKKYKIEKIILSVGYKWEKIKEYFGDNFEGIDLIYSVEDEPLGTGGAIKKAISKLEDEEVFILNGDTFFKIDLEKLSLVENSKLVLALKKMYDFDRYGCVKTDENGLVTAFTEKAYNKSAYINGGIYLARTNIFDDFTLKNKFSFEEFMQSQFKKLQINTVKFNDYFIDIGIPNDYEIAQNEIRNHI